MGGREGECVGGWEIERDGEREKRYLAHTHTDTETHLVVRFGFGVELRGGIGHALFTRLALGNTLLARRLLARLGLLQILRYMRNSQRALILRQKRPVSTAGETY